MKHYERKVEEGQERNEYWRGLSPTDKLASLDRRLGKNTGAKRQREKLQKELEKQ